jgi:hypothetical protein
MKTEPPSIVRVIKHEAISSNEVRITMEMIVNVHRLTDVASQLLHTATEQISGKPKR